MITAKIMSDPVDRETPEDAITIFGGMNPAPSWSEYIENFGIKEREAIRAIRDCIIENKLTETCADEFCNDNCFALSDGAEWHFSWRAWGDLVQAIRNKREGYMAYYMRCFYGGRKT